MTFLPVVQRELRVQARRPWTHRGRLFAASVPLCVISLMSLSGNRSLGRSMLDVLVFLTGVFCLVEGLRTTADCISSEKREGTLGLLFLTDLHGYDVVLGKFASGTLGSFYGLMAMFPVLGLTMLFGGVTVVEFWRTVAALMNLMFASLALGMLVSVLAREQGRALGTTALGLLLWMGLPLLASTPARFGIRSPVAWLARFSPIEALQQAGSGSDFGMSLAASHGIAWVLLGAACVLLPRTWNENGAATRNGGTIQAPASTTSRAGSAGALLTSSPIAWLLARASAGQGPFIGLILVLVVGAGLIGFLSGELMVGLVVAGGGLSLGAMLVQVRVAWCASEYLATLLSSGMLELILITPKRSNQWVDDLGMGLWRRFGTSLIVLATVQVVLMFGLLFLPEGLGGMSLMLAGPTNFLWAVNLFADFYALGYLGLWLGLTTGRTVPAFVRTMLIVFVGCTVVCCGLRLVPEILIIVWARNRLERRLRSMTSSLGPAGTYPMHYTPGAPPAPPPPGVPPFIRTSG